ncbi:unnamed protein product [Closterium sp. NIES-54]
MRARRRTRQVSAKGGYQGGREGVQALKELAKPAFKTKKMAEYPTIEADADLMLLSTGDSDDEGEKKNQTGEGGRQRGREGGRECVRALKELDKPAFKAKKMAEYPTIEADPDLLSLSTGDSDDEGGKSNKQGEANGREGARQAGI